MSRSPDICPRCGGRDVVHLLFGLPSSEGDLGALAPWEQSVGCMIEPYNRVCHACALRWPSDLSLVAWFGSQDRLGTLPAVLRYVAEVHEQQVDKAYQPYVGHLIRVWQKVWATGADETTQMAALLHDTLEDQPATAAGLTSLGVPDDVVRLVELLTRRDDVPDEVYYTQIASDPVARAIKLADIADNTDERRVSALARQAPDQVKRLQRRYAKARRLLGATNDEQPAAPLP